MCWSFSIWLKSHLLIFVHSSWASGALFRKALPMPVPKGFSLSYPPTISKFQVGLSLISLIYFEWLFLCRWWGSSFSLTQVDILTFHHHLLKRLFFLSCMFLALSWKSNTYFCVSVGIYFWIAYSVPLFFVCSSCLLLTMLCCFKYCGTVVKFQVQ
jgi:hypothetical protein